MQSLIYKPHLAQKVHTRDKVETRRPSDPLYPADRWDPFVPGLTFYVREPFSIGLEFDTLSPADAVATVGGSIPTWFHALGEPPAGETWGRKRSSLHLPETLARTHCIVLAHRREPLLAMDEQAAVDEGFESLAAFIETWCAIYGPGAWDQNPEVHVIRFERSGAVG